MDIDKSKYYWNITKANAAYGLEDEIGETGPWNANTTLTAVEPWHKGGFRMKDDDGNLYYEGLIFGDYMGFEPLDEFGMPNAGCTIIEYNIKGKWERL